MSWTRKPQQKSQDLWSLQRGEYVANNSTILEKIQVETARSSSCKFYIYFCDEATRVTFDNKLFEEKNEIRELFHYRMPPNGLSFGTDRQGWGDEKEKRDKEINHILDFIDGLHALDPSVRQEIMSFFEYPGEVWKGFALKGDFNHAFQTAEAYSQLKPLGEYYQKKFLGKKENRYFEEALKVFKAIPSWSTDISLNRTVIDLCESRLAGGNAPADEKQSLDEDEISLCEESLLEALLNIDKQRTSEEQKRLDILISHILGENGSRSSMDNSNSKLVLGLLEQNRRLKKEVATLQKQLANQKSPVSFFSLPSNSSETTTRSISPLRQKT